MSQSLEQTHRVLAEHGIDLCEYFIMCTAGDRIALAPGAFISTTMGLAEGDARGSFSLDEYKVAFERLQSRALMIILDQSDIDRELERMAEPPVPEVFRSGYEAGDVDLSPAGYAAYRAVIRAIHGDEHLAERDTGAILDYGASRFDVYSPRFDLCAEAMNTIEADGDGHTDAPFTRFIERIGPVAIGQWKPNRFITLAAGFHGILRYEP